MTGWFDLKDTSEEKRAVPLPPPSYVWRCVDIDTPVISRWAYATEKTMYTIGGLLLLLLDIYVIYLILTSAGDMAKKLLWVIVVLFLPLLGPILYFLLRRMRKRVKITG